MSATPDSAPEPDLTASYALDPAYVRALTARIVSTSGESVTTTCPFNGQPLATIPQSSLQDVAEAFTRARRAQGQWAAMPVKERAQKLLNLHDLILERQDEITDLICWESRQSRKHPFDEPL